jgi:cob(I)alamin adenosyltransferase
MRFYAATVDNMVVLNKIYTRTGDKGETALGNGVRVTKDSVRVSAYGTVDETNATVGLARLHATGDMDSALARIQNDLFDLGADFCRPDMAKDKDAEYTPLRILEIQVVRLETEIDAMNADIAPLRSFVLPGGSPLAAHLHLCRTVSRRAERLAVTLAGQEDINAMAVKYLNRLSDWFFVASRAANENGKKDVLWVPGGNQ